MQLAEGARGILALRPRLTRAPAGRRLREPGGARMGARGQALLAWSLAVLLGGCGDPGSLAARDPATAPASGAPAGFCGSSTGGACAGDDGCGRQGCSGEVCAAMTEGVLTPCVWRECYDPRSFGAVCGCSGGACRWR